MRGIICLPGIHRVNLPAKLWGGGLAPHCWRSYYGKVIRLIFHQNASKAYLLDGQGRRGVENKTKIFAVSEGDLEQEKTSFTAVLIAGGSRDGVLSPSKTEVFDLLQPKLTCQNLPDISKGSQEGFGGLINNEPVICGGTWELMDQCIFIATSKTLTMSVARTRSAGPSISLPNNFN